MPLLTLIWANNKTGNENAPEANLRLFSNWGGGHKTKMRSPSFLFTDLRQCSLYIHPLDLRMLVCRFLSCLSFSLPYAILPHIAQNTRGNLSLSVSSISRPLPWNHCKSHNEAVSILIFGFMYQNCLYKPKVYTCICLILMLFPIRDNYILNKLLSSMFFYLFFF